MNTNNVGDISEIRWYRKIGNSLETIIHRISWAAKGISIITLLMMTIFVAVDVVSRYVFNRSIKGGIDIQELMMVVMIFLGMGFITMGKNHIFVDLLTIRLHGRTLAIFQCFSALASFVVVGFIVFQMTVIGLKEMASPFGQVTMLLYIPVAPFMFLAAFGMALMALEFLINSVRLFSKIKS